MMELTNIKINVIKDVVNEFFVPLRYPNECHLQTFEERDYVIPQDDLELLLSLYVHHSHRFDCVMIELILNNAF